MIQIKLLPSGYYHARGEGPCNWAQWPAYESLRAEHFFPQASAGFRRARCASPGQCGVRVMRPRPSQLARTLSPPTPWGSWAVAALLSLAGVAVIAAWWVAP
jgi:hypothetical protein